MPVSKDFMILMEKNMKDRNISKRVRGYSYIEKKAHVRNYFISFTF
jgi:hypothetical protein